MFVSSELVEKLHVATIYVMGTKNQVKCGMLCPCM